MSIILIGGSKGGASKTTLATNLACWLAREGHSVALLDGDPHGTAKLWTDWRAAAGHQPAVFGAQASGDISQAALALAESHDFVVVDAPGHDSAELRSALAVADQFLVPICASGPDLVTLVHTDELITSARTLNPDLRAHLVLARVPTGYMNRDAEIARSHIAGMELVELPLAPVNTHDLQAYRSVFYAGKGVVEHKNPKARAEIQLIGQFVVENLTK